MTEDNIAIRLKFLISELGINSSVFADTCGISRATLSQLLTGRNKKVNDILISQIHKAYPNLSILWLLFNEGNMWINSPEDAVSPSSTDSGSETGVNGMDSAHNSEGASTSRNEGENWQKNPDEILNLPSNDGESPQNLKEIGLISQENSHKGSIDQDIKSQLKTAALMNEIEILRSKIRKVVQITIYYDDSTFESFYPK